MVIIECFICGKEFQTEEGTCNQEQNVCGVCCASGWCDLCEKDKN